MEIIGPAEVEGFLKRIVDLGLAQEHPADWNRFYQFVTLAHKYRKKWDSFYVKGRLKEYGLPPEKAQMFSEAYWHGRCSLHSRTNFHPNHPQYAQWVSKDSARLT